MRRVSITELRDKASFAWLREGPITITHHGHDVATIMPAADPKEELVEIAAELGPTKADVDERIASTSASVAPPVRRGVSSIRAFPKSAQVHKR